MADTQIAPSSNSEVLAKSLDTDLGKLPGFLKTQQEAGDKAVKAKVEYESAKTAAELGAKREALEKISAEDKAHEEEVKKQMKPTPELNFSKETSMEIAGVFSMIATMGVALGGSGKLSGLNAMNAMGGMLKGHQQGRKDLLAKEQAIFDKEMASMKATNDALLKDLEQYQKLRVTDKEAAMLKAGEIVAKNGPLIKQAIETGQTENALEISKSLSKLHSEMMIKAVKTGISGKATQQQFIAQRAVTALRGAASAAESIMKLPGYSNVGVLPFLSTKEGMINYVANSGGRSLSAQETKAMQTLFSGVSRYLATIEASGTATGLTVLAGQLDKLTPMKGDTVLDTSLKLADIRRISTESIKAMVESGLLPDQQGKAALEQVARMEKAIPYTTDDVVEAITRGRKTLGSTTEQAVNRKSYATEADAKAAQDRKEIKAGDKITIGGQPFTVE